MPDFISSDGRFGCRIEPPWVQWMEAKARAQWPQETGGILVGQYNEQLNLATVTAVEAAPPDSTHQRFAFVRGVRGLAQRLALAWSRAAGDRRYYLGEWHTHPGGPPVPSEQDRRQMWALARDPKVRCPEPVLMILGGSYSDCVLGVYVFSRAEEVIELHLQDPAL